MVLVSEHTGIPNPFPRLPGVVPGIPVRLFYGLISRVVLSVPQAYAVAAVMSDYVSVEFDLKKRDRTPYVTPRLLGSGKGRGQG